MNIKLSTKELLPALQTVIGVVEKKHNLPILSHVLIETEKNKLKLTTTDTEIETQTIQDIKDTNTSKFTLYAKNLIDIIKDLTPETIIEFDISSDKIKLKINHHKFQLNTLSHQDFPKLENNLGDYKTIKIKANDFKDLITHTSFTIGHQDIRNYLNGLHFEAKDNILTLVATDGHRLSIGTIKQYNKINNTILALLPKKTVLELSKLLIKNNEDNMLNIHLSQNYFELKINNTRITSHLIENKFPNWRQILPEKTKQKIIINRLNLLSTLKNILPLVDEKMKSIKLNFEKNTLHIHSKSKRGEVDADLKIKNETLPLEVAFNIYYLISVLEKLSIEDVYITAPKNKNKTYLFTGNKESDYQYIIMPITL